MKINTLQSFRVISKFLNIGVHAKLSYFSSVLGVTSGGTPVCFFLGEAFSGT